MEQAAQLAAQCHPTMERVALLVDPNDDEVDEALAACQPASPAIAWRREAPERVAEIKTPLRSCAIIKALPIAETTDLKPPKPIKTALTGFYLMPNRRKTACRAAMVKRLDWTMLKAYDLRQPYLLAGGLTAANVADALTISGAGMVDIASGVETAPGEKDAAMMTDFVAAVRGV